MKRQEYKLTYIWKRKYNKERNNNVCDEFVAQNKLIIDKYEISNTYKFLAHIEQSLVPKHLI